MSATEELLRGREFNPYYGNVLELAVSRRWREAHDLVSILIIRF